MYLGETLNRRHSGHGNAASRNPVAFVIASRPHAKQSQVNPDLHINHQKLKRRVTQGSHSQAAAQRAAVKTLDLAESTTLATKAMFHALAVIPDITPWA